MVTHRTLRRFLRFAGLFITAFGFMTVFPACDKMPLLAPGGTVITIFPASTTVALNGEVEIVATVIENGTTQTPQTPANGNGTGTGNGGTGTGTGTTTTTTTSTSGAGTPVQNGTLVTFTTTIGRIEPSEARTNNGQVRVRFLAGGQSGTATITAFSGGASGKIENLRVGAAAIERVILTANPQTLPPSGGTSEIQARVEDASGGAIPGVPVSFLADAGTLNPPSANTDSAGVARTQLTTSRVTKVTANVGGKTAEVTIALNPRTGISITGPTTSVSAGLPATFTVNVATAAPAPNIRDVTVDFGDGDRQSLGSISGQTTVQHTYDEPGTFIVRATATEASGFTEQVSTSVTILPAQPPGVIITTNQRPSVNQIITLTATVTGATSTIQAFQWDFGDGTTRTTTGPQVTKAYATPGTKVVSLTVIQAVGPSGQTQITVDVQP